LTDNNNIPTWDQAYSNPTTPEQFRAERERLQDEQRQPGYVPQGYESWILEGLPPQHPVKLEARRLGINGQPVDVRDLYQKFLKGDLK
jgi:hypothetical protein